MARSRMLPGITKSAVAFAIVVSTFSVVVGEAAATGNCKFCSYSPFSNSVTSNTVVLANNIGANTNVAGPTTQNGLKALIEPKSQANYAPTLIDTYSLNVSAGFNGISTSALAGAVTARFYWNLTWYSSITTAACGAVTPTGLVQLSIYASIYNVTAGSYVKEIWFTVLLITLSTCAANTVYTTSTAVPYTLSYSFTAASGATYQFASQIYGLTFAQAANVGPASGVGIVSFLNVASGYNGQFSAIQVF